MVLIVGLLSIRCGRPSRAKQIAVLGAWQGQLFCRCSNSPSQKVPRWAAGPHLSLLLANLQT